MSPTLWRVLKEAAYVRITTPVNLDNPHEMTLISLWLKKGYKDDRKQKQISIQAPARMTQRYASLILRRQRRFLKWEAKVGLERLG